MQLSFKHLTLVLHSASVDISNIVASNKIFGNLQLVYVALRRDYVSGSPGAAGALDVVKLGDYTVENCAQPTGLLPMSVSRSGAEIVAVTPGNYSWIVVNNCTSSNEDDVIIPSSTPINFRVSVTGQARLELDNS